MTSQSGGGGGGYPGVTSDGSNGLTVSQQARTVNGDVVARTDLTAAGGFTALHPDGGITVDVFDNQNFACDLTIASDTHNGHVPYTGEVLIIRDDSGNHYFSVFEDGRYKCNSGFGLFNGAPVTVQPVLATGAGHTVDSVISLLQSYGLCKQA